MFITTRHPNRFVSVVKVSFQRSNILSAILCRIRYETTYTGSLIRKCVTLIEWNTISSASSKRWRKISIGFNASSIWNQSIGIGTTISLRATHGQLIDRCILTYQSAWSAPWRSSTKTISSSSTTDSKIISTKIRPSIALDSIIHISKVRWSEHCPLILLDSFGEKTSISLCASLLSVLAMLSSDRDRGQSSFCLIKCLCLRSVLY